MDIDDIYEEIIEKRSKKSYTKGYQAALIDVDANFRDHYDGRVPLSMRWLLDMLGDLKDKLDER
jgi:hypothetical protein